MWCRNRSQRRFLHRKSSLSHAQLDVESYILFAFGLVAYGEMAKEGEISGTLTYILEDP
jgi:hypothetical protein